MTTQARPPRSPQVRGPASPTARGAASPLPLILGTVSVALSIVIAIIVAVYASAPIAVLGVPVPLVSAGFFWLSLLGYLLTPVFVIGCYGWDAAWQRNGLRVNRNFVLRPGWNRALLVLIGVAILVGAWHILNLSVPISEWLGLA